MFIMMKQWEVFVISFKNSYKKTDLKNGSH